MQSPPASADATRVIILSPVFARPGASPRSRRCWTSWGRPRCWANVAGRSSPALATRRLSSKAMWMPSGCSSGSIYWVLLVSGRFCVSKTIIPEAPEHFLTSSARRDTHLFGGLGLRRPATPFPLVMPGDVRQVQLVHHVGNEASQVVIGQPLLQGCWQQQLLVGIVGKVGLAHRQLRTNELPISYPQPLANRFSRTGG